MCDSSAYDLLNTLMTSYWLCSSDDDVGVANHQPHPTNLCYESGSRAWVGLNVENRLDFRVVCLRG